MTPVRLAESPPVAGPDPIRPIWMFTAMPARLLRRGVSRDVAVGLLCLATVIGLAYSNVIFLGETLVATSNYTPIDDRLKGAGYENWHDEGATWWQWEPAGQFFGRAYRQGR